MNETIFTNDAPAAVGPYVQAKLTDTTLYTSGQLPINPNTGKMPEDVGEQTCQSLLNVEAILKQAGLDKTNIVKTTVFVKDLNDFSIINNAYAKFFGEHCPARSCVEVARLPLDAKVEIEAVAIK
ncbi:RidA family protein [Vibrio sp. DW001]|uniref:RidA family protein n=1 Tax=Vibrio sp. DW001 TaxID=2912315 RepID=UPI0023AFDB45|nr:RidA family protein [Vibrio sp. DW001]WED28095.1 RidA family protein [Vibrio sp. DW001]